MKQGVVMALALCLWAMAGFGCASTPQSDVSLNKQRRIPELQPNPFLEQDTVSGGQEKEEESSKRPSMTEDATPAPPLRRVSRSGNLELPHDQRLGSHQESARLGIGSGQRMRAREIEQERRFRQDQESRIKDYRRAFPSEPAPRPDSYRSYEGSRPPRRY